MTGVAYSYCNKPLLKLKQDVNKGCSTCSINCLLTICIRCHDLLLAVGRFTWIVISHPWNVNFPQTGSSKGFSHLFCWPLKVVVFMCLWCKVFIWILISCIWNANFSQTDWCRKGFSLVWVAFLTYKTSNAHNVFKDMFCILFSKYPFCTAFPLFLVTNMKSIKLMKGQINRNKV